jgi:hypothetical protein
MLVLGFLLLGPTVARAIDCLTHQLPRPDEPHAETKARLERAGQWVRTGDPSRSVPDDPQVGDTWDWYIWDLGGMPVATLKPCTVRGMGENIFVVVDDDEWNVDGMNQAAVDRIIDHFDNQSVGNFPDQGIWALNTSHFGEPPNPLDGQERIFLLYYRFNIPADGYFWVFDQYPDGTQPWASNEADVIYLATDNGDPGGNYMLGVAAHEFEHMIHFNTDQDEVPWVDEGLAELAMWLFGNPDNISGFNSNPDNSLTSWGGNWADYIQTYLWTLYMYEQFGGQPLIWDVAHHPYNSMTGYQQVLIDRGFTIPVDAVFANWTVANYLDDPTLSSGQWGYVGETLPVFYPWRTHTSLPANGSSSLQNWAGEYVRLTNMDIPAFYTFNGSDPRDFLVTLIALDPALPTLVQPLLLDQYNDGTLVFDDSDGYDETIICVANVHPSSSGVYLYTVDDWVAAVPGVPEREIALRCQPNPFNPVTEISFRLPDAGNVRLLVHDSRGRLVQVLHEGLLGPGRHHFTWNARGLASGIFLASVEVDGAVASVEKVSLVK